LLLTGALLLLFFLAAGPVLLGRGLQVLGTLLLDLVLCRGLCCSIVVVVVIITVILDSEVLHYNDKLP
jgi:hypothetical protein